MLLLYVAVVGNSHVLYLSASCKIYFSHRGTYQTEYQPSMQGVMLEQCSGSIASSCSVVTMWIKSNISIPIYQYVNKSVPDKVLHAVFSGNHTYVDILYVIHNICNS